MTKKEGLVHARNFLKRNRLMTLSTASGNAPWSVTAFFAFDDDCNILFYSREDTVHAKHIMKNPNVAVVVNHDWKDAKGRIRGLQIVGTARKLSGVAHARYFETYRARFSWADAFAVDHKLFLIRPREIWYINQQLFGHMNRVRMR